MNNDQHGTNTWANMIQTLKEQLNWGVELESALYGEMICITQPNSTGDLEKEVKFCGFFGCIEEVWWSMVLGYPL